MITIYTDGSSRGNPGPGGWGAIIVTEHTVREFGGREKHTTNNRMELTAAIRALESLGVVNDAITLHTDSQYVSKGITEWIHGWERNGWKTAARKPVENQDLWQVLSRNVEGKHVEWRFVRGHDGHAANERCDEIATSFADLPAQAGDTSVDLYDGTAQKYPIDLRG